MISTTFTLKPESKRDNEQGPQRTRRNYCTMITRFLRQSSRLGGFPPIFMRTVFYDRNKNYKSKQKRLNQKLMHFYWWSISVTQVKCSLKRWSCFTITKKGFSLDNWQMWRFFFSRSLMLTNKNRADCKAKSGKRSQIWRVWHLTRSSQSSPQQRKGLEPKSQ